MQMKFGDKVVEVDMKDGIPQIKAQCRQIKYPDGRIDVVCEVPCLQVQSERKDK